MKYFIGFVFFCTFVFMVFNVTGDNFLEQFSGLNDLLKGFSDAGMAIVKTVITGVGTVANWFSELWNAIFG